jgi:hypothetical protein
MITWKYKIDTSMSNIIHITNVVLLLKFLFSKFPEDHTNRYLENLDFDFFFHKKYYV